jgi:hypothetical protein
MRPSPTHWRKRQAADHLILHRTLYADKASKVSERIDLSKPIL